MNVKHLKQPLTPPQGKVIVAYHISNYRLAIKTRRWLTIPISRDNRLCHFCSYIVVENEVCFELECPMYNPIWDKFSSLFENVVLGSLKSFFQLDHQVDISLYLTEATALRHSMKLANLRPSWCAFRLISILASLTLKSISIHFIHWLDPLDSPHEHYILVVVMRNKAPSMVQEFQLWWHQQLETIIICSRFEELWLLVIMASWQVSISLNPW